MEQDKEYMQQLMEKNRELLTPLLPFLPWLAQNAGKSARDERREGRAPENSLSFPIYDGHLMSFVKEAAKSPLMDKNYPYVYTRNRIKTHADERKVIAAATWKDWDVLRGILSKYVIGGRVKATLWSEAVQEQIFCLVIQKMKEIVDFWSRSTK